MPHYSRFYDIRGSKYISICFYCKPDLGSQLVIGLRSRVTIHSPGQPFNPSGFPLRLHSIPDTTSPSSLGLRSDPTFSIEVWIRSFTHSLICSFTHSLITSLQVILLNKLPEGPPVGIADGEEGLSDLNVVFMNDIDRPEGYDVRVMNANELVGRQLRFQGL